MTGKESDKWQNTIGPLSRNGRDDGGAIEGMGFDLHRKGREELCPGGWRLRLAF